MMMAFQCNDDCSVGIVSDSSTDNDCSVDIASASGGCIAMQLWPW